MASVIDPYLPTRPWRRAEYDRLVELGIFVGERLYARAGLPEYWIENLVASSFARPRR